MLHCTLPSLIHFPAACRPCRGRHVFRRRRGKLRHRRRQRPARNMHPQVASSHLPAARPLPCILWSSSIPLSSDVSPYNIHVSKLIIGHLNSGSNKTVRHLLAASPSVLAIFRSVSHSISQGVENQARIFETKNAIDSAFSSGKPLGPDIPWRPVDYFEHLDIPSADVLKCSVNGDTQVDRKCLQDVMSGWNARCACNSRHAFILVMQVRCI